MSMHWEMKFSNGVIHQPLLRELDHNGPTDKMHFLLGNHVVRFSKVEFYLITGLHFGVVPDTSLYAAVENDIHQQYVPRANEVSLEELRVVFRLGEFKEVYDVVKLCLIYMLNWILMRVNERFKISVWQFRKEIVPTTTETEAPYFAGLSKEGACMKRRTGFTFRLSLIRLPLAEAVERVSKRRVGWEIPWEYQLNELRESLRKSEDDRHQ
ncbi:hypothetical protein Ddye_021938 [Dipteronia dyeriana]|uniref:DUF1985 domain-containing protein n=1 Tax=Dipteronia dyeriana TaxID=168575 RepID=A0AAD9WY05_9ROSI|nr:hypothetical protein Ddye_021938 [Dipteronia dyeriana]